MTVSADIWVRDGIEVASGRSAEDGRRRTFGRVHDVHTGAIRDGEVLMVARRKGSLIRVQLTRSESLRRGRLVKGALLLEELRLRTGREAMKGGESGLSLMIDESGLIESDIRTMSSESSSGQGFLFVLLSETAGVSFGVDKVVALNALLSKGFG